MSGLASAVVLFGYAWWAPLVLGGAWLATHWLLRESAVWQDRNTDEVREAQRHAEYAYRLAVDPPAAKELRLFGLADWVMERFVSRRTHCTSCSTRRRGCARSRSSGACCSSLAANVVVFWALAAAALAGRLDLGQAVVFAQAGGGRERDRLRRA